jgi:hypothetical protein
VDARKVEDTEAGMRRLLLNDKYLTVHFRQAWIGMNV